MNHDTTNLRTGELIGALLGRTIVFIIRLTIMLGIVYGVYRVGITVMPSAFAPLGTLVLDTWTQLRT